VTNSGIDEPGDVGMAHVGGYALAQLEAAARDPRLDRSKGAAVADYLDYLDEADRVRMLALGLFRSSVFATLLTRTASVLGKLHGSVVSWRSTKSKTAIHISMR
jgi:hypothetical protein